MKYYAVKHDRDNTPRFRRRKNALYKETAGAWIGLELYTEKEIQRMQDSGYIIPWGIFDVVEISKNETYFFFGARFSKYYRADIPF